MNKKGFTITELMVSVVIVSIVMFVIVETFGSMQKAIQFSKDRAIATNLAQEKIQIIREKLYYKVIPSTSIAYINEFNPPVPYDTLYFPPETILEAGVYYKRYTYILPVIESGGVITELPPQTPDTGMKKITVTVVWERKGEKKKVQISTIYTNRDTVMSNAVITGIVRDKSNYNPIPNALINIVEYMGLRDVSDNNGNYRINIVPGNYTIYVEARGYFPYLGTFSISPEQTLSKTIELNKMGYGKMTGVPWLRDHLVISQVVGSTVSPSGFEQEYIEIYNPTTYSWLVNGNIGLRFQRIYDTNKKYIQINYFTDYIQPGGFYLFANTNTITINGTNINADAVWSNGNSSTDFPYFNPSLSKYSIIPIFGEGPDEGGGAIELYVIPDDKILDQVGWNRNDGASGKKNAPFYETSPIPQNIGLQQGEQYVRYSSTYSVSTSYGPAYDSNNNSVDFYDYSSGISITPRNSTSIVNVISATPANGSIVGCSDGLSISTVSYLAGAIRQYAYFELNEISTGTWSCTISSGNYSLIIDSITITNGSTITLNSVYLTTQVGWGYISGMVTDAFGNNISPAIKISGSDGSYTYVGSNKRYLLQASAGTIDVTANPGNLNSSYVSVSSQGISLNAGEIKSSVDFVLYQGGRITGKVLIAGSTVPIPGIAVGIYDQYDAPRDQQITDNTGRFTTNVLSTGTYIIQPMVDSKESVNPSTASVNITSAGSLVFSSTFSVSNAVGYVKGNVKYQNQPIKTGVLVVVTTVSLSGSPPSLPVLSSQTLSGAPYYITSTDEEGNYLLEVRQSTNPTYNIYSFYPHLNISSFTINWSSRTNISVLAGQEVNNINFSW